MIALALIASALAAPPGFRVTKEDVADGCQLMLGQAEADGVVPMRAECHWPDVTVASFDAVFADWANHDNIFSSVSASDTVSSTAGTTVARQTFTAGGIRDREMLIAGTRTEFNGGFRYAWNKNPGDQGITSGNVEVGRSDGYWEVTPHADGGVLAVHQVSYDPGGRVPGFLVRWFQTSGLQAIAEEMHEAAN